MNFTDILLIILSSAGLLHGLAFAGYLCFYKKKKLISNYLLALIMVVMAFRIGKSVMLNFGSDLEPMFIFAGLALLLLIGPLLRWYVSVMINAKFTFARYPVLELIPFIVLFLASFYVTKGWYETLNEEVIIVFAGMLTFIYLHLAFYIVLAFRLWFKVKKKYITAPPTKSQKTVLYWIRLLMIGFVLLWISYVLNIIEDAVPYIVGPIMYAVVVYYLSFKAFQLKVTDLDGQVFEDNDDQELFMRLSHYIESDRLYLEPNVSLADISALIRRSTQKTSEVINQYARQNFNDFINQYRIQEAKKLLTTQHHLTISAIAFDVGFNSLSSFNSAFKKFEGITPSAYRKTYMDGE